MERKENKKESGILKVIQYARYFRCFIFLGLIFILVSVILVSINLIRLS